VKLRWRALAGAWFLANLSSIAPAQDCESALDRSVALATCLASKTDDPCRQQPDGALRTDDALLDEWRPLLPTLRDCGQWDLVHSHERWSKWTTGERNEYRRLMALLPSYADVEAGSRSGSELEQSLDELHEQEELAYHKCEIDGQTPRTAFAAAFYKFRAELHLGRARRGDPDTRKSHWEKAAEDAKGAALCFEVLQSSINRLHAVALQAEAHTFLSEWNDAEARWDEVRKEAGRLPLDEYDELRLRARSIAELADLRSARGALLELEDLLESEAGWLNRFSEREQRDRAARNDEWWLATDRLWSVVIAQIWRDLSDDNWVLAREELDKLNREFERDPYWHELANDPGEADEVLARIRREWTQYMAAALQREGRLDEARKLYDEESVAGSLGIAEVALGKSDHEEAQKLAEDLLKRLKRDLSKHQLAHAHSVRGRARLGLALKRTGGRTDLLMEAERDLREALKRALEEVGDHDNGAASGEIVGTETLVHLARALIEQGKPLEAAAELAKWQARDLRASTAAQVSVDDVRSLAKGLPGGVLVLASGADWYVAVHVARDGSASATSRPLLRRDLRGWIERLLVPSQKGDDLAQLLSRGRELARELGLAADPQAPAAHWLRALEGVRPGERMLVLAPGVLEQVPWSILPPFMDEQGRARATPLVLPGFVPSREPRKAGGLRLLGRPTDKDGQPLLGRRTDKDGRPLPPAGEEELNMLANLPISGSTTVTDLTTKMLEHALRVQDSAPALHIVTHLEMGASTPGALPEPRLASTAGEWITLRQVEDILRRVDANGGDYTPPRLVVLATCSSGRGRASEGRAQASFANLFLEHGAETVVATLWPVSDKAAKEWALAFHRRLLMGDDPATACASAVQTMRADGMGARDWAAFRVMGRR